MKKTLLLLLTSTILFSCEKKYDYIETSLDKSITGQPEIVEKETIVISAKTDSIAYIKAYQKFCISEKAIANMKEKFGSVYTEPKSFKLINEDGKDISFIKFNKIDSIKQDIRERIFKLNNSLVESENTSNKIIIDSVKIKTLDSYFFTKKDEFDPNGLTWHKPKSAPKYTNENGIYCYFQSNKGIPLNLRLRLQYHSDEWLFFEKVQFSIDGKAYEFIPTHTETDSGNGGRIWEWFDEPMGDTNTKLLDAIANGKSVKIKLVGRQYHEIQTMSASQIKDIKRTLDLYKAMGGTY